MADFKRLYHDPARAQHTRSRIPDAQEHLRSSVRGRRLSRLLHGAGKEQSMSELDDLITEGMRLIRNACVWGSLLEDPKELNLLALAQFRKSPDKRVHAVR